MMIGTCPVPGEKQEKIADATVKIDINSTQLDITIEKVNRLLELLREVREAIDSLSLKRD